MDADRYRAKGVRRVVTSVGPDGRGRIEIDDIAPSIFAFDA